MTSFSSLPPLQSLSATATPAWLLPDVEIDIHEMMALGKAGIEKVCANWSVLCDMQGTHPMCSDEMNPRWKQGCVELGYVQETPPAIPHTPHVFTWRQWFNTICSCLSDLRRLNPEAFKWYVRWMRVRALPPDHFLKDPQRFAQAQGVYNGHFNVHSWQRRCASEIGSLCWHSTPAMQTSFEPLKLILAGHNEENIRISDWEKIQFDDKIFVDKESELWGAAPPPGTIQAHFVVGRNAVVAHMKRYMWSGGDPNVAWKKMLVNNAHIKRGPYFSILLETLLQHPGVDLDMVADFVPYEGAWTDEVGGPRTMLTRVVQYRRGPGCYQMLTQLLDAGANPNVMFNLNQYRNYESPESPVLFTALANLSRRPSADANAIVQLLFKHGASYAALTREFIDTRFTNERIPGMSAFKMLMKGNFLGSTLEDTEHLQLRVDIATTLFDRGARPYANDIFAILYREKVLNWGVALFVAEHALQNGMANVVGFSAQDGPRIREARRAYSQLHIMRDENQPRLPPVRRQNAGERSDTFESKFLWEDRSLY